MTNGRKRTTALAALLIALGSLGLHAAGSAVAEPNIDTLKQRVDRLYSQAEKASERFNAAQDQLKASEIRQKALDADLVRQQQVVDRMRSEVASMVVDQYQGQGLSTASQVVFSSTPDSFLDNLNAVSSYNAQRGQVARQYGVQLKRLQLRKQAAGQQVAALTKTRAILKAEKATIDDRAARAKALLSKLQEKQRLALMSGTTITNFPSAPGGRAGAAVKYALSKVGDPYVWGGTGPTAFDCSGLTMMSWAQGGVGLPRTAQAQQGAGRRVSASELKPGDLVFYYSPVHHVGIYIGNGLIVHAANPSAGVRVAPVFSMPFSGATRPGG